MSSAVSGLICPLLAPPLDKDGGAFFCFCFSRRFALLACLFLPVWLAVRLVDIRAAGYSFRFIPFQLAGRSVPLCFPLSVPSVFCASAPFRRHGWRGEGRSVVWRDGEAGRMDDDVGRVLPRVP